jgi:hypothetical protein
MSNDQKTRVALPPECMALPSTEELRALWQRGIESGPSRFASIDEIRKEARRRTAKA